MLIKRILYYLDALADSTMSSKPYIPMPSITSLQSKLIDYPIPVRTLNDLAIPTHMSPFHYTLSFLLRFPLRSPLRYPLIRTLICTSIFVALLSSVPSTVFAQNVSNEVSMKSPKKLSAILGSENTSKQNTTDQAVSLHGMMWNTPSEIAIQQQKKDGLLNYLLGLKNSSSNDSNQVTKPNGSSTNTNITEILSSSAATQTSLGEVASSSIDTLIRLIQNLPVTGRVQLPARDHRWLETHPQFDPVISAEDSLKNPERKNTITVIQGDGRVCVIPFKRSVYANHYAKLCSNTGPTSDWAWVVQADGAVEKVSLSAWNAKKQNYPGPGSWIWVPKRPQGFEQITQQLPLVKQGNSKGLFPEKFSEDFAAFLATQGPSDQLGMSEVVKADRTFVQDIVFDLKLDQSEKYQPKDAAVIASDWGSIGLLQTPTTRMMPAGSALFGYSHTTPYSHYNFALQPFDWLETAFRYSNDGNVAYGDYAGSQSYVDKSLDLKVRLLQETAKFPELAVGLRDITGTGLFSGEYVVANKRYGDFDFSAGLAWGYLGNRGNLKNPFSIFGSSFSSRPTVDVGSGGNFSFGTYFHGAAALIGGLQYQTPYPNLSLKFELDGNNYQREPFNSTLEQRSPINFGAVYRWNNANVTVGVERGNTAMISISIFDNLSKLAVPKVMEAPAIPIAYRPISPPSNEIIPIQNIDPWLGSADQLGSSSSLERHTGNITLNPSSSSPLNNSLDAKDGAEVISTKSNDSQLSKSNLGVVNLDNSSTLDAKVVGKSLLHSSFDITKLAIDIKAQSGWHLVSIEQKSKRWIVTLDEVTGVYLKERMNRVIALLHRDAPIEVSQFVIRYQQHQLPLIQQTYNRQAWMMKNISLLGPTKAVSAQGVVTEYPSDSLISRNFPSTDTATSFVTLTNSVPSENDDSYKHQNYFLEGPKAQRLSGGFDIGYQQTIGGPNGYLFALSGLGTADLQLCDGAWIKGVASLRVLDNYDKFTYDAPSNLPRVRTYMREYLTSNRLTVPNLQATQVAKVGDSHYFSAYGGMLEMMYGGVGGEWLYRPLNSPLAIGVDVNKVRQRDFDQRFNFLDYQVTTGHITGYWQTGWEDVLAKVSYGQYLAGDRGYTVDVSKAFSNGVKMGAYFTRTNVSAEQFGEGSFDKGIYVSIPFDAFFTKFSNDTATILWNPLIRDGGAKLNRMYPLYNVTNMRDGQALIFGPIPTY